MPDFEGQDVIDACSAVSAEFEREYEDGCGLAWDSWDALDLLLVELGLLAPEVSDE